LTDNGHTHTYRNYGINGSTGLANGGSDPSNGNNPSQATSGPTADAYTVNSAQTNISANIGDTGGGLAHENRPPAMALTYLIFIGS
jgi:microcystin-dependent protein